MWRNKFILLALSHDADEYNAAFDIKRENKPNKLYQYRTVDAAEQLAWLMQFIKSGDIYCTPVRTLNDPLDSRSVLSPIKARNSYDSYFNENKTLKSEWSNQITQLPCTVKGSRSDMFKKALYNLKKRLEDGNDDLLAEEQMVRFKDTSADICNFNENINKILGLVRIASFSEECHNMAMFAHYANRRSGICLEFDLADLDDKLFNDFLYPINYIDDYPDAVKFIFDRFESNHPVSLDVLEHLIYFCCLQKTITWSYENEWRYMVTLGGAELKYTLVGKSSRKGATYANKRKAQEPPFGCLVWNKPNSKDFGCRYAPRILCILSRKLQSWEFLSL